ncbi:protein FAR-RED IMPAIRED RESPONSE 1-like protein [Cinnamomum micranthum f. kanehirae]|uniref:Protein FAR-RED IMPAIRED RESPONSE 1-like protein n=1 Tax=Cinnamomum micranthum f. kanehirae TaxID=337451 RepID=A0A443NRN9_9MAGN|nr:protein FAR-RED IMPAIRED RESPONSE 1-like protein [Cinnamomum micranthum f. kanehirae]
MRSLTILGVITVRFGDIAVVYSRSHPITGHSYQASIEQSKTIVQHRFNILHFQELCGFVSSYALHLILKEFERSKDVGEVSYRCGCRLRTSYGLPCAHEQSIYLNNGRPIPIDSINKFWRKLDLSPCVSLQDDDIDYNVELQGFTKQFKQQTRHVKLSLLRKLREIITPSITSIREPAVKTNTRGRPSSKKKVATNTCVNQYALVFVESDSLHFRYGSLNCFEVQFDITRFKCCTELYVFATSIYSTTVVSTCCYCYRKKKKKKKKKKKGTDTMANMALIANTFPKCRLLLSSSIARRGPWKPRVYVTAPTRPTQACAGKEGAQEVKNKAEQMKDKAASAADETSDKGKEMASKVSNKAQDLTEKAKQTVQDAWGTAKETSQKIKDSVAGKVDDTKEVVKENAETVKRCMNTKGKTSQ